MKNTQKHFWKQCFSFLVWWLRKTLLNHFSQKNLSQIIRNVSWTTLWRLSLKANSVCEVQQVGCPKPTKMAQTPHFANFEGSLTQQWHLTFFFDVIKFTFPKRKPIETPIVLLSDLKNTTCRFLKFLWRGHFVEWRAEVGWYVRSWQYLTFFGITHEK